VVALGPEARAAGPHVFEKLPCCVALTLSANLATISWSGSCPYLSYAALVQRLAGSDLQGRTPTLLGAATKDFLSNQTPQVPYPWG
jgi:hypothetical protein